MRAGVAFDAVKRLCGLSPPAAGARRVPAWGPPAWYLRMGLDDPVTRLQVALIVSLVVHAVFLAIKFVPPVKKMANNSAPLEVVLVNAKTQARPLTPDALAQANLDGGGNTDAARRLKTPLPMQKVENPRQDVQMESRRVEELEREAQRLLTQAKSQATVEAAEARPQPQTEPVQSPNSADIMRRSMEIARLEAQISKDWDNYQKRPRRRFIGARTQEFRFARYIEDWRNKIERIGTVNFPEAARNQQVFGSLQLTVAIRSDGNIESVEINRSSGKKILDEAALKIVKLASPYAPFPPEIAQDTDVLSITRTWMFTRADQFVAE
jgi:protein TonB